MRAGNEKGKEKTQSLREVGVEGLCNKGVQGLETN